MKTAKYGIFFVIILTLSCSDKTANLDQVDLQIKQKNYAQAKQLVLAEQQKSFRDTLQYARIKVRLNRIERLIFFQDLENAIFEKNWNKAEELWMNKQAALGNTPINSKPEHFFSLFHWRAIIDSAFHNTDSSQAYLQKAIRIPTSQHFLLQHNLEKLAIIYARQDSLTAARRLFDQSLRMMHISQFEPHLRQIYFLYMDGKFNASLDQLQTIPDSIKSVRWKNLQYFLETYGEKLTLDERFKLW